MSWFSNTPFWWHDNTLTARTIATLLTPIGGLYGLLARLDQARTRGYTSSLPVICIGNYTAGGAGKTPAALMLAQMLQEMGETPCFLTRGYGGQEKGPHWVHPDRDTPQSVGDEPLLLVRQAPVMICANRAEGAKAIERNAKEMQTSVILMDDGFQNQQLNKTLSLIITDGKLGLGNGRVLPAGPLRSFLPDQLARTDAFIMSRPGPASPTLQAYAKKRNIPFLEGKILPPLEICNWLQGRKLIAYSGIGYPVKFYDLLTELGGQLVQHCSFPDHHPYREQDARALLELARTHPQATLVTTQKDFIKLEKSGPERTRLAQNTKVVPVSLQLHDNQPLHRLLAKKGLGNKPSGKN